MPGGHWADVIVEARKARLTLSKRKSLFSKVLKQLRTDSQHQTAEANRLAKAATSLQVERQRNMWTQCVLPIHDVLSAITERDIIVSLDHAAHARREQRRRQVVSRAGKVADRLAIRITRGPLESQVGLNPNERRVNHQKAKVAELYSDESLDPSDDDEDLDELRKRLATAEAAGEFNQLEKRIGEEEDVTSSDETDIQDIISSESGEDGDVVVEQKSDEGLFQLDNVPEDKLVTVPTLLREGVRLHVYQRQGLHWLVSLHDNNVNGILADEMGLGKTAQTIALLAYLAEFQGIWGPHLVVVPHSLMLNWAAEFQKFAPGFRVVVYYGDKSAREVKRKGMSQKFDPKKVMNVLITSYSIAVQDSIHLRRRAWYYLILDEAHALRNSKTIRWQQLLKYRSERKLLLTGTPFQTSLGELWSLLHLVMPKVFDDQDEWAELFSQPIEAAVNASVTAKHKGILNDIHRTIRPFVLRRLKSQVDVEIPSKTEYVIRCQMSLRQKVLYDEMIQARHMKDGTKINMMSVLLKLRLICDHPALVQSSQAKVPILLPKLLNAEHRPKLLLPEVLQNVVKPQENDGMYRPLVFNPLTISSPIAGDGRQKRPPQGEEHFEGIKRVSRAKMEEVSENRLEAMSRSSCNARVPQIISFTDVRRFPRQLLTSSTRTSRGLDSDYIYDELLPGELMNRRGDLFPELAPSVVRLHRDLNERLRFIPSPAIDTEGILTNVDLPRNWKINVVEDRRRSTLLREIRNNRSSIIGSEMFPIETQRRQLWSKDFELLSKRNITNFYSQFMAPKTEFIGSIPPHMERINRHGLHEKLRTFSKFIRPDRDAVERDAGKLHKLKEVLTRHLGKGERCLLYTQFTKMLDILEQWLALSGFVFVRLDGSTKPDTKQSLVDRFNVDTKLDVFLASTRAGGIGLNLIGANVVVFYDSDWNPSVDKQAMDRCHRLGQTKDVHVYRLITEDSVEESIWRKQLHRRLVDEMVIDRGELQHQGGNMMDKGEVVGWLRKARLNRTLEKADGEEDIYATRILHDPPGLDAEAQELAMLEEEEVGDVQEDEDEDEDIERMEAIEVESGTSKLKSFLEERAADVSLGRVRPKLIDGARSRLLKLLTMDTAILLDALDRGNIVDQCKV